MAKDLFRLLPSAFIATLVSAIFIALFLFLVCKTAFLGIWLLAVFLVMGTWYVLVRYSRRLDVKRLRQSLVWHLCCVALNAALIGFILVYFYPRLVGFEQLLIVLFITCITMSGVFIYTMVPAIAFVWLLVLSLSYYITIIFSIREHLVFSMLAYTFLVVYLAFICRDYYRLFKERAVLQLNAESREQELKTLFEQGPLSIVLTDLDANILQVNKKMEELSGYDKNELIGRNPKVLKSGLTPSQVYEELWDTVLAGETWMGEFINRAKDGHIYLEKASISPITDSSGQIKNYLAIKEDISLQREHEQRLEQQNSIIQLLLRDFEDQAGDWLWELSEDFRISYFSEKFLKSFQGEQVIGRSVYEFIQGKLPAEDYEAESLFLSVTEVMRNGKPLVDLELKIVLAGNIRWIAISALPLLNPGGKTMGWRGVGRDITDKKLLENQLFRKANIDELSGLPNRASFKEMLDKELSSWDGNRQAILGIIKLENFDIIRVNLGSASRNKLLHALIQEIYEQLGKSIVLARLEKDEFAFWIPDSDIDKVATIHKLGHRFEKPFLVGSETFLVDLYIGIAFYPDDALDRSGLFRAADLALNNARVSATRKVMRYRENLATDFIRKLSLLNELDSALESGQFAMYYQAQIGTESGRLVGAEALIRWQHPDRGQISPGEFVALAEQSGFITRMGEWTFSQVCKDAVLWEKPLQVSINVSGVQLRDSRRVVHAVTQALKDSGLDPERLILEITESAMFGGEDEVEISLSQLRKLGIKIALDDFGTGYSSLAYIQKLHLDKLKIDQSFVQRLDTDADAEKIVSVILDLAKSMNLETVAEGVETKKQARLLKKYSCDWLQGYLFSKAIPQEDFRALIRKELKLP